MSVKYDTKFNAITMVQLHHIDGNHDNWKPTNLMAVHQSCHQELHWSKYTQVPPINTDT
ncbi:MAG: HNH endonuclease [Moorea sp. SIO2I5]|nr:HNH endonuclease [Moorena sp. SIO2I5]